MATTHRFRALLFWSVCSALALGVVTPGLAQAEQGGRRSVTVLVPEAGNLQLLAFWVALGGGYFARAGLDVHVVTAEAPAQVESGFKGGAAPVAILPGPDYERLIGDRFPFLIAANLLESDPIQLVMRREVANRLQITNRMPVRQRLAALRGLSIGVAVHDRARLYQLFRSQELDANLAQIVVRKGEEQLSSFASGGLDAIFVATPYLEKAIVDHDGIVLVNLAGGDVPSLSERMVQALTVTTDFAKTRSRDLLAIVQAVAKAEHVIHFEPSSATEAILHALPTLDRKHVARVVALYAQAVPATPHVEAQLVRREAKLYPVGGEPLDLTGIDLESYVLKGSEYETPRDSKSPGTSPGLSARAFLGILGALVLAMALLVAFVDQRQPGAGEGRDAAA